MHFIKLMNGTSMSSPNAAGCIALILSGAKQSGAVSHVRPPRLRHALDNSCKFIPGVNPMGQGSGLIQVNRAFQHLVTNLGEPRLDYHLEVEVVNDNFTRGIYLRHPSEVNSLGTYKVTVKPIFPVNISVDIRIGFEWTLELQSSAAWVRCADYLMFAQSGKTFSVEVDPTLLGEGFHTAYIRAYVHGNRAAGFVCEVPITVIKPIVIFPCSWTEDICSSNDIVPTRSSTELTPGSNQWSLGVVRLEPGERYRKFIVPPLGCTYIDAIITDSRHAAVEGGESCDDQVDDAEGASEAVSAGSGAADSSGRMVLLHALQLIKGIPYRDNEKDVSDLIISFHANFIYYCQCRLIVIIFQCYLRFILR